MILISGFLTTLVESPLPPRPTSRITKSRFLAAKYKNAPEDKKYDVFFVLDCSSLDRIEPFISCFNNASKTVCIDHHVSNTGFTDLSKIEPQASSACEVLYGTMDADKISRNVAECIYTGIIHDTGVFFILSIFLR